MIYVASSWRNERQPWVVSELKARGFSVYDFRHPAEGDDGFHWSEIGGGWASWTLSQYLNALDHPVAVQGFGNDMDALRACSAVLLVMPCGRSAHLEAGWAVGAGKPVGVLHDHTRAIEPELMLKMCDAHFHHIKEARLWLEQVASPPTPLHPQSQGPRA